MIDFLRDPPDIKSLTVEQIKSVELIKSLYAISDEVQRMILQGEIEARAKELKCKTDFEKLCKAEEKNIKEERKRQSEEAGANIENRSNEYQIAIGEELLTFKTGKWKVDADGVRQVNEDGIETNIASRYPIIISHRLVDCETNTGKVVLTWMKEDETTSIPVERSIIASKQKIVDLSAVEFPVDSETARNLVTYLGDFEKLNGKTIGRKKSISKFGWYEKQFIPFTKDPILALPPKSKLRNSVEISGHGDFEKWMELAKKIRKSRRQEPLLYMAAALGSILVPIKAITPFIVDLYCPTGRGKTINMKFAASIWGNPSNLIKEATSTINALETILGTLNNIPLMIDDISKIQDDETGRKSTDMIYRLTAGSGKERRQANKNEVEDTSTWSNIIITNMERPLETETMKGGALNRVLDFEAQDGDIFDDFGEVSAIVSENYGFFGRIFTLMVIKQYDSIKGIIEGFEQKIKDFAKKNGQQKDGKQIIPLAILLTADQLTEEYFQDGMHLDMKYCINQLKDIDSISEMKRAWGALNDEVITNRMNYVPDGANDNYRGKIYGKITEDDEIVITKSRFSELAKENNFSVKQFLNWTDKQGLLDHDAGRKTRRLVLIANDNKQYCYVFKRKDIEAPPPETVPGAEGFIIPEHYDFDDLPAEVYG